VDVTDVIDYDPTSIGEAATKGKMRRSILFRPAVSAQTLAEVPHFGTGR
jgi:hypothetical protein